ncbi:MAG: MBL fold metallo-hydrolase [Ignavibacteriaceae bacterium]|nr:MBL fold metallo-hydrolase [Ignavibacteriaceae bacterium]
MVKVKKFVFNEFYENTYILYDSNSKVAAVIDPGCRVDSEKNELTFFIDREKLQVKYLINTHCHLDHVFGNKYVKEKYTPLFYIPEKDLPLLLNAKKQGEAFGVSVEESPSPDGFIDNLENLILGESELKFLYTPGHSPGEFSIYLKDEEILIAGDVLFKEGIGRTDLWGGNYDTLIHSIKTKLLVLPENTLVYSGHGEETTIGYEKKYNPYLT